MIPVLWTVYCMGHGFMTPCLPLNAPSLIACEAQLNELMKSGQVFFGDGYKGVCWPKNEQSKEISQ